MANLTSIIRITGTIGGRTLNFSHTYTLEDVYDVAQLSQGQEIASGGIALDDNANQMITMPQLGVDYIFCRNNSPQNYGGVGLTETSNAASLICSPNQFCILCANTTGEMFAVSGSDTTTLVNPDSISSSAAILGLQKASTSLLIAFNATT